MGGVRFVLVRSRSPGNVGAVARAMKNFGLADLVLVDPRMHRTGDAPGTPPYFETESRRMAWRAADLLDSARTVDTLAQAVAPCSLVLATAPRGAARMDNMDPERAARRLADSAPDGAALVFGSESSGLTREELSLCSGVVVIPTDPAYRDLNVAQSAVILAYLLQRAREGGPPEPPSSAEAPTHADREGLAAMVLEVGRKVGFLTRGDEPVGREVRALIHRAGLTRRDTQILRSLFRRIRAGRGDGP
jgi:TrmH family RNA methyltransferase